MTETERRGAERHEGTFPVSMVMTGSVELEGKTINYSRTGVVLEARGRIKVELGFRGKRYNAQLVRVHPIDDETIECAIALEELLDEANV